MILDPNDQRFLRNDGYLKFHSFLQSSTRFFTLPDISMLRHVISGLPAVCLNSLPDLSPQWNNLHHKAVLIAHARHVPDLRKRHIHPHLCLIGDSGSANLGNMDPIVSLFTNLSLITDDGPEPALSLWVDHPAFKEFEAFSQAGQRQVITVPSLEEIARVLNLETMSLDEVASRKENNIISPHALQQQAKDFSREIARANQQWLESIMGIVNQGIDFVSGIIEDVARYAYRYGIDYHDFTEKEVGPAAEKAISQINDRRVQWQASLPTFLHEIISHEDTLLRNSLQEVEKMPSPIDRIHKRAMTNIVRYEGYLHWLLFIEKDFENLIMKVK